MPSYDRIKEVKNFESLVDYLYEELDWPIEVDDLEDIAFEYGAEELGLEESHIVKTKEIKQVRPLARNQPWGVFYIEFESKRLPVVVLRRILRSLVTKKRASATRSDLPTWDLNDLLFISAVGEAEHRGISFAHFRDNGEGRPQLRTFSWDARETHFHYLRSLNLEKLRWPENDNDNEAWKEQWASAFPTVHRQTISTSRELSLQLAHLAQRTRDLVHEVYTYELKTGPLHQLHESFRIVLVNDLELDGFADMVAQTIAYGLFSARATGESILGLANLESMVPNTNPFLRELFAEFTRISGSKRHQIDFDELGVAELVELLNETGIESVLRDFGRQTGGGAEDPVIHFYELFLSEYDKRQKVQRGIFYTPKPVVSFIVRSVDELLRTEFDLKDGLADTTTWGEIVERNKDLKLPEGVSPDETFIQILDPATGTGTFLETVIDAIYETMTAKWRRLKKDRMQIREAWNGYVPKHLLPRLHGFELMMAPYAVAHMKLGLKLAQTGYDFRAGERLRVYLTNTLEPTRKGKGQLEIIPEFLSHEAEAADQVKQSIPITVVIGNPPYSGISSNMNDWIDGLLKGSLPDIASSHNYYEIDGQSLGEKKLWLQDDYVKFIRMSHWLLNRVGAGVHGMITNHSFLDSPTCRGMRYNLASSFSGLAFIDLHGSTKKQENPPNGVDDQNIFEIQPGVAISLLWKPPHHTTVDTAKTFDLWANRSEKYSWLSRNNFSTVNWAKVPVTPPYYLFGKRDIERIDEYQSYFSLKDIFPFYGTGIQTSRDKFATDFDRQLLQERVITFLDKRKGDSVIRETFGLKDTRGWKLDEIRKSFDVNNVFSSMTQFLYRTFDRRWIALSKAVVDWPREEIMSCVNPPYAIGLLCSRQQSVVGFRHAIVVNEPVDMFCISNKSREGQTLFPLYHQHSETLLQQNADRQRWVSNVGMEFSQRLQKYIGLNLHVFNDKDTLAQNPARDVFHYVYAILYSPDYRTRYAELLKMDYPRIPLTKDANLFLKLCAKGKELVTVHLMESSRLDNFITEFHDSGDRQITKAGETKKRLAHIHDDNGRLYINRTAYFDSVPTDVWEFHIGGYQVCHKWLDDRKKAKRSLSDEDITHYQRIIVALNETIRLMAEIDEVIDEHGGWPLPGSISSETERE